ncbi:MAG: hypothetical protein FJY82_01805 [Candidatus Aminicenantes bacterium]|nr:hypothetical protein [Candidatus Aminicenantes bacterium]
MRRKTAFIVLGFVPAAGVLAVVLGVAPGTAADNSKRARAERLWKTSGHAAAGSVAFRNWDAEGAIPASCAKCHSTPGFLDFLGADGTAGGLVEKAAPVGTTVECGVCHVDQNSGVLRQNPSVQFPSGVIVGGMGAEGLCMECHQGRASKATIDSRILNAGAATVDTPSSRLTFANIHYYAAAASQFGTVVKGGYEYAGKTYDARFSHVPGYNACHTCHNPHSLEVNLKACATCHVGATDPKDIRYLGSCVDYDGDGDSSEGMYYELKDVQAKLYRTLQAYAKTVVEKPIVYDPATYPYFFNDTNGNGRVDPGEAVSSNGYASFTVRSLKAAYNFQVAEKDPNGYAHNGKYLIELMFDGIEDLNERLEEKTDLSRMRRGDEGHFDGSTPAFRNWDSTGTVPAACALCHSATGLPKYLAGGQIALTQGEPSANGFLCSTCHTSPPALRTPANVRFPSGAYAATGDSSHLCMVCHQGRQSQVSVDAAISANPGGRFSFLNIHYYPAAAIFFGTEVKGGYEFPGKAYLGRQPYPNHNGRYNTCVQCHMNTRRLCDTCQGSVCDHNVAKPNPEACVLCHGQDVSQTRKGADPEAFDFEQIRPANIPDYDGDGNVRESLKDEILGLEEALYAQIKLYTASVLGETAVYYGDAHPYWFKDLNGNGIGDPAEAVNANRFSFDARSLRAAYNYQVSHKDPHGFIHNARYIAQILVDAIEHLGGNAAGYIWR